MNHIPDGAIHTHFELSYANYLVLPRTVLQSMSLEWQDAFVDLLNELNEKIDWQPHNGTYWIKLRDDKGRFIRDPLMDYERGRRRLPLRSSLPARSEKAS